MKKGMGLLELLIVAVIIIVIYFTCFHGNNGRVNPFEEQKEIKTKQEMVNTKLKDIENQKAIKEKIEQNLNRDNY